MNLPLYALIYIFSVAVTAFISGARFKKTYRKMLTWLNHLENDVVFFILLIASGFLILAPVVNSAVAFILTAHYLYEKIFSFLKRG